MSTLPIIHLVTTVLFTLLTHLSIYDCLFDNIATITPFCNSTIPPIVFDTPSILEFVKYIQSQQITPKIIDDELVTEEEIFTEVLLYDDGSKSEDIHLSLEKLVNKYGFQLNAYEVETKDGYILTVHNIPGDGPPLFFMHSLFSSADTFFTAGPISSIAYYFARKGYDVYLGNGRGSEYSQKHTTISPKCAEFWDFSWHEVGIYDLPAMIDFVLDKTGYEQLYFVGHAQGSTNFFVMTSELPEYNDKIKFSVALCPIAWIHHMKSPVIRALSFFPNTEYSLLRALGISKTPLLRALSDVVCGDNKLAKIVCSSLVSVVFGADRGNWNVTALPVQFGRIVKGSSTKQLVHYLQEVKSERFCQYDLGKDNNMKKYGSETPPDYHIKNITAPVLVMYSDNDWISNMTDVFILRDNLPNVAGEVLIESYWHFDYLWAKNVNEKVNDVVLQWFKKYPFEDD